MAEKEKEHKPAVLTLDEQEYVIDDMSDDEKPWLCFQGHSILSAILGCPCEHKNFGRIWGRDFKFVLFMSLIKILDDYNDGWPWPAFQG